MKKVSKRYKELLNKIDKKIFIDVDNSEYCNSYYSVDDRSYYNPLSLFIIDSIIKSNDFR